MMLTRRPRWRLGAAAPGLRHRRLRAATAGLRLGGRGAATTHAWRLARLARGPAVRAQRHGGGDQVGQDVWGLAYIVVALLYGPNGTAAEIRWVKMSWVSSTHRRRPAAWNPRHGGGDQVGQRAATGWQLSLRGVDGGCCRSSGAWCPTVRRRTSGYEGDQG